MSVLRLSVLQFLKLALLVAVLMSFLAGVPGPLIGMVLMLIGAPIEVSGLVSGLIYTISYPIEIIASNLFYLHLREVADSKVASAGEDNPLADRDPAVSPGSVSPQSSPA